MKNEEYVNKAFSAQSPVFDGIQHASPMLEWMRSVVHRHMDGALKAGDSILDINAGTGIDAMYFASKGHRVHAMDIAEGMVARIREKIAQHGLTTVTTEQRSYQDAAGLAPQRFDHIFSNFGGLNCVPDLRPIAEQLTAVLAPGGLITMVIMPKFCPWEVLQIVRGDLDVAFRRLHPNGVMAHIEGVWFRTWYHSVRDVRRAFGDRFELYSLRGVASFSPPPTMEKFPRQLPKLYSFLQRLDEQFCEVPPFDRWADQFIITLRQRSAEE